MSFRSQKQMEWLKVNKPELYEEFKKTPPEDEIRKRGVTPYQRVTSRYISKRPSKRF